MHRHLDRLDLPARRFAIDRDERIGCHEGGRRPGLFANACAIWSRVDIFEKSGLAAGAGAGAAGAGLPVGQSGCESLLRHPASNGVRLEALVQRMSGVDRMTLQIGGRSTE
jgi:hypothetical protein